MSKNYYLTHRTQKQEEPEQEKEKKQIKLQGAYQKFLEAKEQNKRKQAMSEQNRILHNPDKLDSKSRATLETLYAAKNGEEDSPTHTGKHYINEDSILAPFQKKNLQKRGIQYETYSKAALEDQFKKDNNVSDKGLALYMQYLKEAKNKDINARWEDQARQLAKDTPAFGSPYDVMEWGSSLPAGVLAAAESVRHKFDADSNSPVDTNSGLYRLQNFNEAYKQQQMEDLKNRYADSPVKSTAANIGYGAYMSTGEMVPALLLGAGAGEAATALGAGEKAASIASKVASLPSFGATAYSSTLKEAQNRGLPQDQAVATAVVSGVTEMATEILSLDYFWDIARKGGKAAARNGIVNLLAMSGIEGSEEGANDVINEIADRLINADQSEYSMRVQNYMNNGYTEQNAKKQATLDFWAQFGTDVAAGAISGGVMGGGAVAAQSRYNSAVAKNVEDGDYLKVVENLPTEESAYENKTGIAAANDAVNLAQSLAKKAEDGTEITQKEKKKLVGLVSEARQNMSVRSEAVEAPAEEKRSKAQIMADMSQAKNARELTKAYHEAVENIPAENRQDADNLFNIKAGQLNLTTAQVNSARMSDADVYNAGYENKRIEHLTPQQQVTYREGAMKRFEEEAKARAAAEVTGKASNDAGKEFTVKEIKSLDSKDMTLLTDDGEVKLSQVKFANDGEQTLYNQAAQMGSVAAAKAYVDNYVPGMPVDAYDRVAQKFYTAGQLRTSFDSMRIGPVEKQVGTEGLRALYDAGREVDKAESKIAKKTTTAKKGEGKLIDSRENKGKTLHRGFLGQLAEKLGIDVELKDTDTMAKEYVKAQEEKGKTIDYATAVSIVENQNGMFEPAMGRLILNADNPDMYKTLFHELSEFGQAYNAEGMDELRIAMMEYVMDKAPDTLRSDLLAYQRAYRQNTDEKTKSISEASEELFNDMLSEIFRDEAGINDFVGWVADNKSEQEGKRLIQRLAEWIKEVCEHIANFIKKDRELKGSRKIAAEMDVQRAQEMRSKLLQAFDEAIKNRDALVGQKGQAEVRHSLEVDTEGRKLAPRVKKFFKNSKLVDEQGRLKEMYHGTRYAGFTVFQLAQMDDGASIFLSDNPIVSKSYAGTKDFYEPDRPWSFNELETVMSFATGGDWQVEKTDSGVRIIELGFIGEEDTVHDFASVAAAQEYFINEFFNEMDLKSGESAAVYRLYGNATNPLVIDAKGNNWNELDPVVPYATHYYDVEVEESKHDITITYHDEDGNVVTDSVKNYNNSSEMYKKYGITIDEETDLFENDYIYIDDIFLDKDGKRVSEYGNTREWSKYARENGYDSVIFNNVIDSGLYGANEERFTPSTVAVVFNPNQVKSIYNQNPTENEDIRYSIDVQPERVFYTKAGTEVVQNPTSQEYSQMREDILKDRPWLRGTGEPLFRHTYDEQGNEYYWDAMGGLHAQVEPEINKKYNTRTSQQWNWWTREDKDDYPVDYGTRYSIELGDVEKEAIEHFGTTDNFRVAGYMLQDGTLLDFSGAHWLDGASPEYIADWKSKNDIRQVDHEDIYEVMEASGDNRKQFMERGNIRLSPEAPGINVLAKVEPTAAQYRELKEFIREIKRNPYYDDTRFYIDIEDEHPNKIVYANGLNEDRIINDLKKFYETGEMPKDNSDIRFSLGGIMAFGADMASLDEAKKLHESGTRMEDIFRETGWYLSVDNRWKFEISNQNAELFLNGEARFQDEPDYKRMMELKRVINDPKTSDEEMFKAFDEYGKLHEQYEARKTPLYRLDDIMKNDELYKAYPSLRKITVLFRNDLFELKNMFGNWNSRNNQITLDDNLGNVLTKETLLHEVQHAIQSFEGFAGGASPQYWGRQDAVRYISEEDKQAYAEKQEAYEALRRKAPKDYIARYDEQNALMKEYSQTQDKALLDRVNEICVELTKENPGLISALEDAEWEMMINEPQYREMMPSEAYYITAGEIEAREVSERMNMSLEERRNRLPRMTDENGRVLFAENPENPWDAPNATRYSLDVDYALNDDGDVVDKWGNIYAVVSEKTYSRSFIEKNTRAVKKAVSEALSSLVSSKPYIIKSTGQLVYVEDDFSGEYVDSKDMNVYHDSKPKDKLNIYVKAKELIENAYPENGSTPRWEENTEKKHSVDAKRGWNYYKTGVAFKTDDGYEIFDAVLNIRLDASGKDCVYDITKIKKVSRFHLETGDYDNATLDNNIVSPGTENATANDGGTDLRYSLNIDNDFGMWDTEDLQGTFIYEDGQEIDLGNSVINAEETISGLARYLQAANEPLKGHEVNASALQQIAEDLVKKYNSTADVNVVADNLKIVFDYLQKTEDINYNEITKLLSEVSRPIIEQSGDVNEEMVELYEAFKGYIKTQRIALTDGQKKAFDLTPYGSFNNYRKANFGTLNFVNDGASLDSLWTEMCEKAKGFLDVDTNEEDMGIALADALTAMKPQAESLYGYDAREASIDLAGQIMEAYYKAEQEAIVQDMIESGMASPTAKYMIESARKDMKKEIMDYREKTKKLYNKQLKDMQGKISEIMAVNDALAYDVRNLEKKNEQLTKKMAEQVVKAKARNKTTELKRYVEAEEIKKQKTEINKIAVDLLNRATNPTDKKHMPESLRKPIAEFLTGIDFVSHRAKLDSKNTLTWRERMTRLANFLDSVSKGEKAKWDDVEVKTYDMQGIIEVMDPDLLEDMKRFVDRNPAVSKVSKLPSWDLKELHSILSRLRTAVNKANEMFTNEQYKNQEEFNREAYRELAEQNDQKNVNKFFNRLRDFFNKSLEDPVTYFELLGKAPKTLFDSFMRGFDKRAEDIKQYVEFMKKLQQDKEQFYKWEQRKHTFTLADDKEKDVMVEMTEAQIMALYESMKRDQARNHLITSGFRASKVDVKGKEIIQYKTAKFTPQQYQEIISVLSEEQIEVADAIQKFMAKECAKWGNNVSTKLWGYKKFNEPNYFPIKTDASARKAGEKEAATNNVGLWSNKNISASKELVINANNPVIIGDIFDIFSQHVTDMATYDGMVLPQMDAMRWYNYTAIFEGPDGTGTNRKSTYSMQYEIERLMGEAGKSYFTNFMLGINGMEPRARSIPFINTVIGNYKRYAVMAKIRVMIQQPTALMRALDEMNGKYLTMAMTSTNPAKYAKIAQEKSMLAWWKAQGYYETYLGKSVKEMAVGKNKAAQLVEDAAGFGAQKADDLTWGILYHAVEYEIKDTTQLKPGTEEFDEAVVKRFEDVVSKTQVVDTMLHRTDIMRSQSDYAKMLTSFMAEPLKTYNMLLRSTVKFMRDKKEWKRLMRALMVYVLTQGLVSAVTSAWDAVKDDDDKTEYGDRFLNRYLGISTKDAYTVKAFMGSELWQQLNPLGMIPLVKDVSDLIESKLTDAYYSETNMQTAFVQKVLQAAEHLVKASNGERISKTPAGMFMEGLQALSMGFGLPYYNWLNDLRAVYNGFFDNIELTQSRSDYGDLHQAIAKGKNVKEEVRKLLDMGKDKDGISRSITSKFKAEYQEATGEDKQQIRENVTEALVEAGYTQEEAQNTLDKWDGVEVTEPQYEEYHSDYESVYDSIDKGGNVQSEVQKMLDSGKQPAGIKSAITRKYKDQLVQTRDANLRNALVRAYMAAGDTNEEANEKIESWLR